LTSYVCGERKVALPERVTATAGSVGRANECREAWDQAGLRGENGKVDSIEYRHMGQRGFE
jgi:hypothetical protein